MAALAILCELDGVYSDLTQQVSYATSEYFIIYS